MAKSAQGSMTFGHVVLDARRQTGLTQADVAEALGGIPGREGLHASFLSDVERDHRALPRAYWRALVKKLPSLSFAALAAAELRTRSVKIDPQFLSSREQQSLTLILASLAEAGK